MWPHFGHVKDVPLVVFGVLGVHDLHEDVPLWKIALFNCAVQIANEVIRSLARDPGGGLAVETVDAELALDVHLDVLEGPILFVRENLAHFPN